MVAELGPGLVASIFAFFASARALMALGTMIAMIAASAVDTSAVKADARAGETISLNPAYIANAREISAIDAATL